MRFALWHLAADTRFGAFFFRQRVPSSHCSRRHIVLPALTVSASLAFANGCCYLLLATCNQQLPQYMDIPAQDRQTEISLKTNLAVITASLQAITRLQCANGRLDSGMPLTQPVKLHRAIFQTFRILLRVTRGNTRFINNLCEFLFVLRSVKTSIKRCRLDHSSVFLLRFASLVTTATS